MSYVVVALNIKLPKLRRNWAGRFNWRIIWRALMDMGILPWSVVPPSDWSSGQEGMAKRGLVSPHCLELAFTVQFVDSAPDNDFFPENRSSISRFASWTVTAALQEPPCFQCQTGTAETLSILDWSANMLWVNPMSQLVCNYLWRLRYPTRVWSNQQVLSLSSVRHLLLGLRYINSMNSSYMCLYIHIYIHIYVCMYICIHTINSVPLQSLD